MKNIISFYSEEEPLRMVTINCEVSFHQITYRTISGYSSIHVGHLKLVYARKLHVVEEVWQQKIVVVSS